MDVAVLFISLFLLIMVGVPVGFAIGAASILCVMQFTTLNMAMVGQYTFYGVNSFTIIAIPLFMLAGTIMSRGGIAARIVDFATAIIGFVRGATGCVAILACMFFGALSGSGMATASAIGGMLIPEMAKTDYDKPYAATVCCFGGIIGPIIPPSISFVLYGTTAGVSISDMFIGGIIPGVFLGICLITVNILMCKRYNFGRREEFEISERTFKTIMKMLGDRLVMIGKSFVRGFFALLSPVIILGGIYSGIFTPTEAAAVSVVYSLIVSTLIYRSLDLKGLYRVFVEATVLNGITSFLLGTSQIFSAYLGFERIPEMLVASLLSISGEKIVILLLINVFLLFLGCFLDTVPAVIIMTPILAPVAASLDVNLIHFGIIMCVNLAIGLCTPPYGCNLFVGAAVAHIKMESMFKYIAPFMIAVIVGLLVITFVPWLSTCLLQG